MEVVQFMLIISNFTNCYKFFSKNVPPFKKVEHFLISFSIFTNTFLFILQVLFIFSTFVKKSVMPKLYEYFGLIFLFYSNEHEPIHIHGRYQGKESKAEIIFENGKFKEILINDIPGKAPLDVQNLKKFKKIITLYRDDIVRKWIDFFVYNIEFPPETITKKL